MGRANIVMLVGVWGLVSCAEGASAPPPSNNSDPIAPNTTPEGRERNRRIEIVLNRQGT